MDISTYVAVFSFLHPGRCTYVYMLHVRLYYDTCAPLHQPVYMYVHVRDQNDNSTYASTWWVPTIRHFLACEDVACGSQQSGGTFFSRNTVARPVGPNSWGGRFFHKILVAHPVGPRC